MSIDLLTPPQNFAICKMHERAFPGIVVQGDSFFVLFRLLKRARALRPESADDESLDQITSGTLDDLDYEITKFAGVLSLYEQTCFENGYKHLPYVKSASD